MADGNMWILYEIIFWFIVMHEKACECYGFTFDRLNMMEKSNFF